MQRNCFGTIKFLIKNPYKHSVWRLWLAITSNLYDVILNRLPLLKLAEISWLISGIFQENYRIFKGNDGIFLEIRWYLKLFGKGFYVYEHDLMTASQVIYDYDVLWYYDVFNIEMKAQKKWVKCTFECRPV